MNTRYFDQLPAIAKLAVCLFASLLAGIIGSVFTFSEITSWYATLAKPFFTPPNWVFGPAWTTLYILIGISFFLLLRQTNAKRATATKLFLLQLVLNALWSIVFFGGHSIAGGVLVIIALWFAVLANIAVFWKISKPAALLLVPYIAWISFASALNTGVMLLN